MSSSTPSANRFEALDGWRGICACLVVLFHFHGYSPLYTSGLVRNAYLFVDFFFVLSGFVIAVNYASRLDTWPNVRRFLVLRAGRVWPLHFFMLALLVAYEFVRMAKPDADASAMFTGPHEPFAVLTNFFLVQSLHLHEGLTWNGPAWSISTELWTYVLFALVSIWMGMRNWMLLLAALVAPVLLLHISRTGMDTTYDYGLIRCVFGFALGVACFRVHERWPTLGKDVPVPLLSALEILAVVAVVMFVAAAGTGPASFLAPFIFAIAVQVFAIEGGWVSRLFRWSFLKWLGTLSYSIYLTHYFFVMLFPRVWKRVVGQDLWTPMPLETGQYVLVYGRNALEGTLFYAAVLAITLAFSVITYRWVEAPGRDWSRRWAGPSRTPKTPSAAHVHTDAATASSQRT